MSKRILFIDDEPEFIKSQAEALTDEGYEVVKEMSVDQAIKRLQKENFDLIILDLLMPPCQNDSKSDDSMPDLRETGVKLHREIRNKLDPDIEIIFLSVVRDGDIRKRIRDLEDRYDHKVRFLTKPILPSEVIASVQEALENN